jgi:hypothetical protein
MTSGFLTFDGQTMALDQGIQTQAQGKIYVTTRNNTANAINATPGYTVYQTLVSGSTPPVAGYGVIGLRMLMVDHGLSNAYIGGMITSNWTDSSNSAKVSIRVGNNSISVSTEVFSVSGTGVYIGTATAGTAPLKFTSGPILTTAEAGVLEYDGSNIWMTADSVLRKTLVGAIYTHTSVVTVANTVTETSILTSTYTLPANFFKVGKTLSIKLTGFHSAVSNPNINIKIKFGSTVILTTGTVSSGNSANAYCEINALITCYATGAVGTVSAQGMYNELGGGADAFPMTNTSTIAIDTTAAQVLDVTLTWGIASTSNTSTFTCGYIEIIN